MEHIPTTKTLLTYVTTKQEHFISAQLVTCWSWKQPQGTKAVDHSKSLVLHQKAKGKPIGLHEDPTSPMP
jgi:hypothetical protein